MSARDHERARKAAWVPFPRFFSLFGYWLFASLGLLVLLELTAHGAWSLRHRHDAESDRFEDSPCFSGQPWAGPFLAEERRRRIEQRSRYVAFRTWAVAPWHGHLVSTVNTPLGELRTTTSHLAAACAGQPRERVWVFGGSTVYGAGVPDWATVPSYLSAVLNERAGACAEIWNLGVEGYVTNQEMLLLIEELKSGAQPDVVIFYDGVNDSYAGAVDPGVATEHLNFRAVAARVENTEENQLLRRSYLLRFARKLIGRSESRLAVDRSEASLQAHARAVVANYRANIALVRELAEAHHLRAYFFWQPSLFYGDKPLSPFEASLLAASESVSSAGNRDAIHAVYARAESDASTSGAFRFLGHLFDAHREPLYLDTWMHLAPRGNEIVARALAAALDDLPAGAPASE